MTFSAGASGPARLTKDEVANLRPARYLSMWKDIINGVSVCLLRASGDLSSNAGKRMLELISEARNLKGTIQALRPDTLAEVIAQTAQMHGPPSAALWRWVASSIKMSPAQQQDCMKLRNAAFTSLGRVLRHRSELAHTLASFAQIADAASEGYLSLMTVSAQLHSLLTRENSFNCQIMMALFGSILSPVQVAQCNCLAFPYQLDSLAFIEALATCAPGGSPPAVDLIERGAAATLEQGPLTLPAHAMAPGVSVLCY